MCSSSGGTKIVCVQYLVLSHSVSCHTEHLLGADIKLADVKLDRQRVSLGMNTRPRDLAADLTGHITQTNIDVVAVRQEMAELGEQMSSKVIDGVKTVSDNVIECRNKILAEKENNFLKFRKVQLRNRDSKGEVCF